MKISMSVLKYYPTFTSFTQEATEAKKTKIAGYSASSTECFDQSYKITTKIFFQINVAFSAWWDKRFWAKK